MKQNRELIMTEGSLWDKILKFSLPLAATGILQQLFNAADIAVVGRFTGDAGPVAMAAVGANSPLLGLILFTFIGISLGANVVIANAVGRQDAAGISRTVHTSIVISIIGGVITAVVCEIFAPQILSTQNVPEEVLPMAVLYFRIYIGGLPIILLYNFESAIFRGIGNTRTPLVSLMISGVLNVALNLFFVIALNMTVDGVAIATVLSNLVSAVILLIYLVRTDSPARVRIRDLGIDRRILKNILRIGIPAGVQGAVFSIANIIIQTAINSLGTIVMAASSAAYNVEIFAYNVLNSFSQACTTFVGQNYGAGRIDRCKRSARLCMLEGVICTAAVAGLEMLFARQLLGVFNGEEQVIEIGYIRLIYIFSSYIFTLAYEVIGGYLRGFGISVIPAILTTVGICGVRITWIYTYFRYDRTFAGIMAAYPLSLSFTALLLLIALIFMHPAKHLSMNRKIPHR